MKFEDETLSARTARLIREMIAERDLQPGDRLQTVQDLSKRFGVSLSVIREAVASLRAEGILNSRQGAGIFVAAPSPARGDALFFGDLTQVSSIVDILELRLAVEVEAAGLAAERVSIAQESRILEAFEAIETAIEEGLSGEEEDSRFHIAIAEATNNKRFVDFLVQLGRAMIPRSSMRPSFDDGSERAEYLAGLQQEHRKILEAIAARDAEAARQAMRAHLSQSRDRYHNLIRSRTARS